MGEARVHYTNPKGRSRQLPIIFDGPKQTFELGNRSLEKNFLKPVDDRLNDLLEIAATVFASDGSVSRGGDAHANHGEKWRRRFHFEISVRNWEFWRRPEVTSALVELVEFLTDDEVSFTFEKDQAAELREPYFKLADDAGEPFRADEVAMFSGGLDSVAGVLDLLRKTDKQIALVTHRSAPKLKTRQDLIVRELRRRRPGRLLWVPIKATRAGQRRQVPETTQRSRSFLFLSMGLAVSEMFGADGITFFENGIVSQNLHISEQVVGTSATRTTHPYALILMAQLGGLVAERPFPVRNPFAWETKTDVVERFRIHRAEDLIKHTTSCFAVRGRSRDKHHCGACNQCLDRTFALLASGLQDHEAEGDYETDVLRGDRTGWRSQTIAQDWTRHSLSMATIGEPEFLERHLVDVFRITKGFPELPPFQAMPQILDLHRRHGAAVRDGLVKAIRLHAAELADGTLAKTSLLRAFVSDRDEVIDPPVAPRHSPRPPAPETDSPSRMASPGLPLQVEFVSSRHVRVRYLSDILGDRAAIAVELKVSLDEDRRNELPPESYRCSRCCDIADKVDMDETEVRQHISRIRKSLAKAWIGFYDAPPDQHLLIQTRPRSGYRLDPTILLIRHSKEPAR